MDHPAIVMTTRLLVCLDFIVCCRILSSVPAPQPPLLPTVTAPGLNASLLYSTLLDSRRHQNQVQKNVAALLLDYDL